MKRQLWLAFAWVALMLPGAAWAQSDVVFMTADDFDLVPSPQSRLYRFDGGVQTYAVDTGGAPTAFHGVTTLGGNVLVADFVGEAVQEFSPDGTYLGQFVSILDPRFLETDSAGNVYVSSDLSAPYARRYNSSGMATMSFAHPNMGAPLGIDADASGNVYIADNGGTLFKFASNGTFLNSVSLGAINPFDLAIDEGGGRLFLADELSAAGVKIFDISGALPTLIGSITTPANASIVGVHYAAESGNVLATDVGFLGTNPRGFEFNGATSTVIQTYIPLGAEVGFDITTLPPIPEPTALTLVVMAVGAVWGRYRRI